MRGWVPSRDAGSRAPLEATAAGINALLHELKRFYEYQTELYQNLYDLAKCCVETAQTGSHNGSLKILQKKTQPPS